MPASQSIVHISIAVARLTRAGEHAELGEFVAALPRHLQSDELSNTVIAPYCPQVTANAPGVIYTGVNLQVLENGRRYTIQIHTTERSGVKFVFLATLGRDCASYAPFQNSAFFAKAAWQYIVHVMHGCDHVVLHDWHGAPLLAYLSDEFRPITTFVLHDFREPGLIEPEALAHLDAPLAAAYRDLNRRGIRMAAGDLALARADRVLAVSPTYRAELQNMKVPLHREMHRFDPDMITDVCGMLHGVASVDTDDGEGGVNAAQDLAPRLKALLARKSAVHLGVAADYTLDPTKPLIVVTGTLGEAQGTQLLADAPDDLLEELLQRANLVICGALPEASAFARTGETARVRQTELIARLHDLAERHEDHGLVFFETHDANEEARLLSAADIALTPALFAPSGLAAMQALARGAVPVAFATGGASDALASAGYTFKAHTSAAMFAALTQALDAYADPAAWAAELARVLHTDHSWAARVASFRALFTVPLVADELELFAQ